MNKILKVSTLSTLSALIIFTGCGDDSSTTSDNSTRFETATMSGDTVERDNTEKLEWVGSSGAMNTACVPNGSADIEATEVVAAKAHCDNLTFAGHSDWRVATSTENATHITEMQKAGKTPFYMNPSCPRLIGVENNNSANVVNTHNTNPTGTITEWSTFRTQTATNFGVKCVRDIN